MPPLLFANDLKEDAALPAIVQDNLDNSQPSRVIVTDLDIPFVQLIWLSTKIILAALPAFLIAISIMFALGAGLGGVAKILEAIYK